MGDAEVRIRAKIEFQFFKGLENYSLLWNCVVHCREARWLSQRSPSPGKCLLSVKIEI